jgi:hypothetical protein
MVRSVSIPLRSDEIRFYSVEFVKHFQRIIKGN